MVSVLPTHLHCPKHMTIQPYSVQGKISEIHKNFIFSQTLANQQYHFTVIPLHQTFLKHREVDGLKIQTEIRKASYFPYDILKCSGLEMGFSISCYVLIHCGVQEESAINLNYVYKNSLSLRVGDNFLLFLIYMCHRTIKITIPRQCNKAVHPHKK